MNKKLIQSRFARHLDDYNTNATVQKKMAENLVAYCLKSEYNNVLEIGCGTGFLTKLAVERLKYKNYTAIDIVPECKDYIANIDSNINFIPADIETFDLKNYDLIISNAALQWTEDFSTTSERLKKALNPDGELIFSTFGIEHFREIFYISGTALQYPSEEVLKKMFKNISINSEIYITSFSTPKDVLKHLHLTGVNSIENKNWTKKDLKEFENAYSNLCIARPTLTYNPLYIRFQNKTVG